MNTGENQSDDTMYLMGRDLTLKLKFDSYQSIYPL